MNNIPNLLASPASSVCSRIKDLVTPTIAKVSGIALLGIGTYFSFQDLSTSTKLYTALTAAAVAKVASLVYNALPSQPSFAPPPQLNLPIPVQNKPFEPCEEKKNNPHSIHYNPTSSSLKDISLENRFSKQACQKVDISANCGFEDYLSPNEGGVHAVKEHLEKMSPGLIVSCGTERSFFDLLLSEENKCTGLVVRDINPRVKAYVDYLTLLLRLSETRQDFLKLSSQEEDLTSLLDKNKNIPPQMKQYYHDHLHDFAKTYFRIDDRIPKGNNKGTEYRTNDELFAKLKRYADSGKIIATIGEIGDLEFLQGHPIAIVDTSNIRLYSLLDIRGTDPNYPPRIIHTYQDRHQTGYSSYVHLPLTSAERAEFDQLLSRMDPKMRLSEIDGELHIFNNDIFNKIPNQCYSPKVLPVLKQYVETHYVSVPGIGPLNVTCGFHLEKLNDATPEQLKWFLESDEVKPVANGLIKGVTINIKCNWLTFKGAEDWLKALTLKWAPGGTLEESK